MRKIHGTEHYNRQIEEMRPKYERLDISLSEINTIANTPDLYPVVMGTDLHRLKINSYPGVPALSIYFRFDEDTVFLLRAEELESEE